MCLRALLAHAMRTDLRSFWWCSESHEMTVALPNITIDSSQTSGDTEIQCSLDKSDLLGH